MFFMKNVSCKRSLRSLVSAHSHYNIFIAQYESDIAVVTKDFPCRVHIALVSEAEYCVIAAFSAKRATAAWY